MSLAEIDRMTQTVSADWDSPVADQVAAAWGHPPGAARWWRSSASHVFVIPGPGGRRYLRFVPDTCRASESVAAVTHLVARLKKLGSAVVAPVPTAAGDLTVTVATELGRMHATVVEAAPGEQVDIDDLTVVQAERWGQALARLHHDAAGLGAGLPEPFGELAHLPHAFAGDRAVVDATARLLDAAAALPRDEHRWGVVHGDFELDNIAWQDDHAMAYDFDEAAVSWYAADVAYAVRDLGLGAGRPTAAHRPLLDAFVLGYRSVRPLDQRDLALLPLFSGLHAATSLVRIRHALGERGQDEEPWLERLRAKLTSLAQSHRQLVIDIARQHG